MNKFQKMAWFNLTALIVILIASSVFILWLVSKDGTTNLAKHLAGLSGLWFLVIIPLMISSEVWAKKQRANEVSFDERDLLIQVRSLLIGTLGIFGTFLYEWWLVVPPDGLAVIWLPILLASAALIGGVVYSIAILAQYHLGGKNTNKFQEGDKL